MRQLHSIVLAALLCSIPCIAHADLVNQEQFEKYIVEGVNHYKAGANDPKEYKVAIEYFEKAKALNNIPDVVYNIGRSYHMMGDCENALKNYREYALTSAENSEKVKGYIDEMSKQCSGRMGKINIRCVPENAKISIDGAEPVACSGTHDLSVGDHAIVAMADAYMPEERDVTISADDKNAKSIVIEMKQADSSGLFPTGADAQANGTADDASDESIANIGEASKPLGILFWSGVGAAGLGVVLSIAGTSLLATSYEEHTLNLTDKLIEKNDSRYNGGAALLSLGLIATTAGAVLFVLDRVLPADDDPQAVRIAPSFGVGADSASAALTVTF